MRVRSERPNERRSSRVRWAGFGLEIAGKTVSIIHAANGGLYRFSRHGSATTYQIRRNGAQPANIHRTLLFELVRFYEDRISGSGKYGYTDGATPDSRR